MHKRIAERIKNIVDESPYTHFRCEIIPSENNSDGFWKCKIHFDRSDDAQSEALIKAIPLIGLIYGEYLTVNDYDYTTYIEIS